MSTRAAPGPQLSTGRLRVDAARAIAKLREYQLVDRTAWVLEAIRAAVASNATAIHLSGDANDVWLAWEGPPWPAEDLPRLFDELVSPEPTEERHHLRLLAAAVNSALGIGPAFVDIYASSPEGTVRARYTPDVLVETAEIEDSALRKVAAEPASPPGIAYPTGMLLHVRRRAALGMLTYLFWEREPPELATARAACRNLAIPIAIGNTTLSRDHWGADLLRVELGGDLDGFVALCDPSAPRPAHLDATLEVAERGVVLAVYSFALAPGGGSGPFEARAPVPLRVFVDAKRMPTNASRSQVRREVPPIATAEQRAPALVEQLVAALAVDVTAVDCDPRKRAAALALIASRIAGAEWSSRAITERLGPLATVPLLRDAAGVARAIGHPWSGHVYTGREPLDSGLGPWVSSILWIPRGDPGTGIIAGATIDARDTKRRLKWAKQQRRAHRKFFAHTPRTASLQVKVAPRLRVTVGVRVPDSCVPESWFANMSGELALSFERGDGEILLLFQGRPLERVVVPSPIGFDAIVDAENLTPGDGYKSVQRDLYFTLVERAVRGTLICAAEAIALGLDGHVALPGGFTEGPHSTPDVEARAVRAAIGIARDLSLTPSVALAKAHAWPTIDGEWIDFHALGLDAVIGVASTTTRFPWPANRRILHGSGQLLAKLLPNTKVVDYDKRRATDQDRTQVSARLAHQLASEHRFALAISEGEIVGAIAPSTTKPTIHLHHTGHALDKREYTASLGACALAVDSDAIVPDVDWRAAGDTAGAHARNYRDWEVALVRATLRALAGDRPAELIGPAISDLDNPLVEWTCNVLRHDNIPPVVDPVLDAGLIARVKAAPIIHVLGEHDLISIDQVVKRSPTRIFYVDKLAAPVEGFTPVVARPAVAEVIGKLAGLAAVDGNTALDHHRKQAARNVRLALHRKKPVLALASPYAGPTVEIDRGASKLKLSGLVGVGRNRLEIDLRIENRSFQTLTESSDFPLYAVIDLDIRHMDDQFIGLAEFVTTQLMEHVKATIPALLEKVATTKPLELADPGPTRTLLHEWLSKKTPDALPHPTLRRTICEAPAFQTIQKTRVSLANATTQNNVLRTASWAGDWLGPGIGESESAWEHDVIQILDEDTQLATILQRVHPGSIVDVSDEVSKLQSGRRMARGLLPTPSLPHVPAELKRRLSELGDIGVRLGHGEIGLVADTPSVLIHDHGRLQQRKTIDVFPAVQLAVEAPDLLDDKPERTSLDLAGNVADQLARLRDLTSRPAAVASLSLTSDAQELALRLIEQVLATGRDLPIRIKRSIRLGLLQNRIPRDLAGALPVFELVDGAVVAIDVVDQQVAKFGNVWAVTESTTARPLDDDRIVLMLQPAEITGAEGHYAVIDAGNELALDAEARRNREKQPVASLELPNRDYVLAQVELEGDGKTSPRGVVAPLMPHAVEQRGIFTHRELVPFGLMADPCRWPTVATIDDARLIPDRTWARPRTTTTSWTDLTSRVSAASERALAALVPRGGGALAHLHVGPGVSLGPVVASSKLQIRGGVWLGAAPRAPVYQIEVFDSYGRHFYSPEHALGMAGMLYVHAPEGWDRQRTLGDIVPRLYGHLVTQLIGTAPTDAILAHIATALALEVIEARDAGKLTFECFRPVPLDVLGLAQLFSGRDPIRILPIGGIEAELIEPDAEGVIEDGSELSQAVIARLGARGVRGVRKRVMPAPPAPMKVTATPEIKAPAAAPQKPRPAAPKAVHPIQNVVDAVEAHLVERVTAVFGVSIAEVTSPILAFAGTLQFAGRDSRLHAISNALSANSPWAPMAIDALAAHAITVLDAAYSEVNQQTVREVLSELLVES